jgi:hypothetical protein
MKSLTGRKMRIFLKGNSKNGEISSQSDLELLKVHILVLLIKHLGLQIGNATNITAIDCGKTVDNKLQLLLVVVRPYLPEWSNLIQMFHFLQFD